MRLIDFTLMDLSVDQVRRLCAVLDPLFGSSSSLPSDGRAARTEGLKRLERYQRQSPNMMLPEELAPVFPTLWAASASTTTATNSTVDASRAATDDGGDEASQAAATPAPQSSASTSTSTTGVAAAGGSRRRTSRAHPAPNSTVDARAQPPQGQAELQQDARTAAELLADDALRGLQAALPDDLRAFWAALVSAGDELVGEVREDLWTDVHNDAHFFEAQSTLAHHYSEAAKTLRAELERRNALRVHAALDARDESPWPPTLLAAAIARAQADRVADVDVRRPVTTLSHKQSQIVHDKQLLAAHATFNVQHMVPEKLKELEKASRSHAEAANRAGIYLAIMHEMYVQNTPRELFDTLSAALRAQAARDSQEAARERLRLVADKTIWQRATEPLDHVSRLPVVAELTSAMGLKSSEQFFASDRTRKRLRDGEPGAARSETDRGGGGRSNAAARRRSQRGGAGGRGRGRGGAGRGGGGAGRGGGGAGRGAGGSWNRGGQPAVDPAPTN